MKAIINQCRQRKDKWKKTHVHKRGTWMNITHPKQQWIFHCILFIYLFLYVLYCLFYVFRLLLLYLLIHVLHCFILIYLCFIGIVIIVMHIMISIFFFKFIFVLSYIYVDINIRHFSYSFVHIYIYMYFFFFSLGVNMITKSGVWWVPHMSLQHLKVWVVVVSRARYAEWYCLFPPAHMMRLTCSLLTWPRFEAWLLCKLQRVLPSQAVL